MKRNRHPKSPFDLRREPQICLVATAIEARQYTKLGFCPIECSFGTESVIDELVMDHHGEYRGLQGVAVRAYRDHYGARRNDPRFVCTGFPDEDATFAIGALAGILPHPSLATIYPEAPPGMQHYMLQDLLHVAELINAVDIDPNRVIELLDSVTGRTILAFRQRAHPTCEDWWAWAEGVSRWRSLLSAPLEEVAATSASIQQGCLQHAREVRSYKVGNFIAAADFSTLGRNSSYYRLWLEDLDVLVAFIGGPTGEGICSFVCKDLITAKEYFGPDGLIDAYPMLTPGDCGGREILGGSSRLRPVTWEQACSYAEQFQSILQNSRIGFA